MARTMRAFVLTKYGGPDSSELRDVPVPEPGPGQVRIRVHAAGLNPVDFKIREGKLKMVQDLKLPVVMGNELAGTVESLGSDVTTFAVGDRVYSRVNRDMGALAEYACVNADVVARMPASLSFTAAAGLPLAGLTALQALRDVLHVSPGNRVFIPGGAGGVGTLAIQIAKILGAASVATTASSRGEALVRRLGADVVVDYTTQRFEDHVKEYDGAFDLMGGDTLSRSFSVVRKGATVVSVAGMPEPGTARDIGRPGLVSLFWLISAGTRFTAWRHDANYRFILMRPSAADLAQLAEWVDASRLEVVVDKVFPIAQAAEAMAYLEAGRAKGKVVVRFVDD